MISIPQAAKRIRYNRSVRKVTKPIKKARTPTAFFAAGDKKHLEKQCDYIASAHSIIEDLYTEILNTILDSENIITDFDLKEHFNTGQDFEDYISALGFDSFIDQNIFPTKISKSTAIDPTRTETYIKQGISNRFALSTNRVKMQSLIILFKLNKHLSDNFLVGQYDLKKLFNITTIIMYLDKDHKQNNNYNEIQASFIIDELLDLVKRIYNNNKVINWRN